MATSYVFGGACRVKNKNPSAIQITAEQILREARDQQGGEFQPPKQKLVDSDELLEYRVRKRKEFEDKVRRTCSASVWVKYARWEESQRDMLWYKYVHMEEVLGAVANARQVFERWTAWKSFVRFELRYGEVGRARSIYERFVREEPRSSAFVQYAKFETKHGEVSRARHVYEQAVDVIDPEDDDVELLLLSFANQEVDRARAVYRFGLDRLPKSKTRELYAIEDMLVTKKRLLYEDEVTNNPLDSDSWFDYLRLEESLGDKKKISEVYERAVTNVPPKQEKRYWKRILYEKFIEWDPSNCYAWLKYAEMEKSLRETDRVRSIYQLAVSQQELDTPELLWTALLQFEISENHFERARQLYEELLNRTKHLNVWISYAEFEASSGLDDAGCQAERVQRCRAIFHRAFNYFSTTASTESIQEIQQHLLEAWLKKEVSFGFLGDVTSVQHYVAKGVKRKRTMKILEAAYNWKMQKTSLD
uniref:Pre-mRNA-splicing factor Syf1/CRNKL1-like C-terminal HAT-repeats domain-containing protein n=1 Tax=Leersia perrieri TaxID=77586 RepID=A0A0D9W589_9ORYZ